MSFGVFVAVVIRPWLWRTAMGAMFGLAPRRWWARRPYLPIPASEVVAWRKTTAYGTSSTEVTPGDLVAYLQWRRTNT